MKQHPEYVKLSKSGLKRLLHLIPKPHLLKTYFLALSYSRGGHRRLGRVWEYGFHKGEMCWEHSLRVYIGRKMKLCHKQVRRNLDALVARGVITETTRIEVEDFGKDKGQKKSMKIRVIAAQHNIAPSPGEKYIRLPLRIFGLKAFDAVTHLENALIRDAHPKEDPDLLRFKNIPKRTRRYRMARQKALFRGRQKMSPIKKINPTPQVECKTTQSEPVQKNYDGWIFLDRAKVPWWLCTRPTEFQKSRLRLRPGNQVIFHAGKVYHKIGPHRYRTPPPPKKRQRPIFKSSFTGPLSALHAKIESSLKSGHSRTLQSGQISPKNPPFTHHI